MELEWSQPIHVPVGTTPVTCGHHALRLFASALVAALRELESARGAGAGAPR